MSTGEAFSSFVHAHSASLYRTAYLLTGDPVEAEELVQDVLARIYPRWDRVGAMSEPVGYVRRSVVNAFVSSRRRSSARNVPLEAGHELAVRRDLAEAAVDRQLVWGLLSRLPARTRAALVLRYFHDWPDADIAAALGCRAATVRSLLSRGLRTMRADQSLGSDDGARQIEVRNDRLGGKRT